MRALLLALLFSAGCLAYAGPAYVDCYTQVAPHPYCSTDFVWIPGWWSYDWYGNRVWNPGYYQRRGPVVRDHRR